MDDQGDIKKNTHMGVHTRENVNLLGGELYLGGRSILVDVGPERGNTINADDKLSSMHVDNGDPQL